MPVKPWWAPYAAGIAALVFVGYVILTIAGRDTSNLFIWFTGSAGLLLNTFVFAKQQQHSSQIADQTSKLEKVAENVNGRMTQLIAAKTLPNGDVTNDASGSTSSV